MVLMEIRPPCTMIGPGMPTIYLNCFLELNKCLIIPSKFQKTLAFPVKCKIEFLLKINGVIKCLNRFLKFCFML